jgi:hypothetical protein
MKERDELNEMIRYAQRLMGGFDDGIIGDATKVLIERNTYRIKLIDKQFNSLRKLIAIIQFTALSNGIAAGTIDGLIGPQTRFAFEQLIYLEKHSKLPPTWRTEDKSSVSNSSETIRQNPHGFPTYTNIKSIYGEPTTNLKTVRIPFEFRLAWDISVKVERITCHRKVAPSLMGILEDLLEHYGLKRLQELGIDLYGGCFNHRKMRGGKKLSTHSWGAAIDLHPEMNQLRWNHKKAVFAKEEYQFLLESFAGEGWVSLGVEKDYDWMHFQAVKL